MKTVSICTPIVSKQSFLLFTLDGFCMTRAAVFLLCTSMFALMPVSQDVMAKTYRAPHGIAFQSARDEMRAMKDLAPASGDVAGQAEPTATTDPAPPVSGDEKIPDVAASGACVSTAKGEKGQAHAFYYVASAKIQKSAGNIKIQTDGGILQYQGAMYRLRGLEILPSTTDPAYPMQMRLWHEKDGGERVMMSIPVQAGDVGHAGFEMLMASKNDAYVDIAGLLPTDKTYTNIGKACAANADVLVLSSPVSLSLGQIARFKNGL